MENKSALVMITAHLQCGKLERDLGCSKSSCLYSYLRFLHFKKKINYITRLPLDGALGATYWRFQSGFYPTAFQ